MANLNNTMCNCEGFYNAEEQICEPLQANSPDPCPATFWGNLGNWAMNNVSISGVGGGNQASNYMGTPNTTTKDNTYLYVLIGLVVVGIIYFATKKK